MYTIYADNDVLYSPLLMQETTDPADIGIYAVTSPKLTLELNKAGSLQFSVPMTNHLYSALQKLKTIITVMDDDTELWSGRILDSTENYYKEKQVFCEGRLAFLNDSWVRPYEFNGTPAELFSQFLTGHNSHVEADKQFLIGDCTVTDPNDYIVRSVSDYSVNTLQEMTAKLTGSSLGGYFKIRHTNDGYYLDYLEEAGQTAQQIIEFGQNLLDLKKYVDASGIYTIIIPIGADGLTIKSVNNGLDYLESSAGIALFGRIEKVVKWDDVTVASNLMTKGSALLEDAILTAITLECSAVDMKMLGVDVESFRLGDRIRLVSVPHDIDEYFTCSKVEYDLASPQNTRYTLGMTRSSLTGRSASSAVIRGY